MSSPATYRLRLFVAGNEPNSRAALANVAQLVAVHLPSNCELEVIDVLVDYQAALDARVLVTPTLMLVEPPPRVTVLGDLSDTGKVLAALRLPEREP